MIWLPLRCKLRGALDRLCLVTVTFPALSTAPGTQLVFNKYMWKKGRKEGHTQLSSDSHSFTHPFNKSLLDASCVPLCWLHVAVNKTGQVSALVKLTFSLGETDSNTETKKSRTRGLVLSAT